MYVEPKLKWNLFGLVALLAVLLPLTAPPTPTQAQEEQCFEETGLCVSGRILQYWQQNGGLPVFGLPITEQREETIGDWTGQVQWFERNRLELHPANEPPYNVLLGRLGATFVERNGGAPRDEPRDGCQYFDQTGYNVCGDFLAYWQANGLSLDGQPGFSAAESLALFGLPLTGEFETQLADGSTSTVQWFERARFELHPENAPPYNVLLTRLGVDELRARGEDTTPQPQPGEQPAEEPAPADPPAEPAPADPPAEPAPTAGGQIAFNSTRTGDGEFGYICVMNTDGSNVRCLQEGAIPAWSPDGSRIAFQSDSDRDGNWELYVMNADGSNVTRLTNNPGFDGNASWSPDGSRIVYQSARESEVEFIYVMNSDGSNQTRLTDLPGFNPDWSPDGLRIAFETFSFTGPEPTGQVWVMDASGGNETPLTDGPGENFSPSWSPDGSRIAYTSVNDDVFQVSVMNADGSNQTRLTTAGENAFPDWSPDGSQIVFQSVRDGNNEIYVMNADGSNQTRLTNEPAFDGAPAWAP